MAMALSAGPIARFDRHLLGRERAGHPVAGAAAHRLVAAHADARGLDTVAFVAHLADGARELEVAARCLTREHVNFECSLQEPARPRSRHTAAFARRQS